MQLTSDSGWNTVKEKFFLQEVISALKGAGIRVSIFVDPDPAMVEGAKEAGADRIELYTGPYAWSYHADRERAIAPHIEAAQRAIELGLGINAGHDLNLDNLRYFAMRIPGLQEVSIGHALISDALYYGLSNVIGMYQHLLRRE
jgi:pyridoxine 5-phosphate synthase